MVLTAKAFTISRRGMLTGYVYEFIRIFNSTTFEKRSIVLSPPCDLPILAKKLRALNHAITTRSDCTIGRDIEAARVEMDIRMKEIVKEFERSAKRPKIEPAADSILSLLARLPNSFMISFFHSNVHSSMTQ